MRQKILPKKKERMIEGTSKEKGKEIGGKKIDKKIAIEKGKNSGKKKRRESGKKKKSGKQKRRSRKNS